MIKIDDEKLFDDPEWRQLGARQKITLILLHAERTKSFIYVDPPLCQRIMQRNFGVLLDAEDAVMQVGIHVSELRERGLIKASRIERGPRKGMYLVEFTYGKQGPGGDDLVPVGQDVEAIHESVELSQCSEHPSIGPGDDLGQYETSNEYHTTWTAQAHGNVDTAHEGRTG
jgi:hypothetical protein